jgi:hypothetical protein
VGFSVCSQKVFAMQTIAAQASGRKGQRRDDATTLTFRRRIRHLHALGPRPIGEVLAGIIRRLPQARGVVDDELGRFAEMDPAFVQWAGADDWIEPASVLCVVAGGRRS